jgi:hypothetical protein
METAQVVGTDASDIVSLTRLLPLRHGVCIAEFDIATEDDVPGQRRRGVASQRWSVERLPTVRVKIPIFCRGYCWLTLCVLMERAVVTT